jgi:NitT/TauT family transport system permease protein
MEALMRKIIDFIKKYWITICIYLAMFLGYKYIADNKLFGGFLFPTVDRIGESFKENIGTLFMNMFYSFQLMIPAIVIAAAIAVVGGTILGMQPRIREVVYPVVYSISVIPSILMSPFALLIAPSFRSASLFLVVYNTIWATLFATINGIMTIDKRYLDRAKTLDLNVFERFWKVIMPAAMPSIMSGFITSLRGSFVVLVYAEMYGAKYGMGFYVKKFAEYGLYSEAWSGFIFMVIVLVIVMQIFERIKNYILRWAID